MTTLPALTGSLTRPDWAALLSALAPASRRAYKSQLQLFQRSGHAWTRQGVTQYLAVRAGGVNPWKPRTVQQALAAIKYAARELLYAGSLDHETAAQIRGLEIGYSGRQRGEVTGQWLTLDQVREVFALLGESNTDLRDGALLALMIGCGLRRSEASGVLPGQYASREGRRVILDLRGKHGRVRTVPVPGWAASRIEAWMKILSQGHGDLAALAATLMRKHEAALRGIE